VKGVRYRITDLPDNQTVTVSQIGGLTPRQVIADMGAKVEVEDFDLPDPPPLPPERHCPCEFCGSWSHYWTDDDVEMVGKNDPEATK